MKNKVLVELIVPSLDEIYNIYLPINKKIGNIIQLLNKSLCDLTNGLFIPSDTNFLYDNQGERYDINLLVRETNIRNGSSIVLF